MRTGDADGGREASSASAEREVRPASRLPTGVPEACAAERGAHTRFKAKIGTTITLITRSAMAALRPMADGRQLNTK